ncbi:MAG: hypothetical protein Q4G09_00295 [Clostridia bacterium]|nr:hypothetical protein [Clostridia bacterium]
MKNAKIIAQKIICLLIIMIIVFPSIFTTISFAVEISSAQIKYKGDCTYHLQFDYKGNWNYVTCSYVYYEQNGVQYPAYCLNKEYPGVGGSDGYDTYSVNVNQIIDDVRIWRVAINRLSISNPS